MDVPAARIWSTLIGWDHDLFRLINSDGANPVFDAVMPLLRTSQFWAPLYLFLIAFALLNFKGRGWLWVGLFLLTVAMTDMTGTYLFKHNVERIRPCNLPDLADRIRMLVPCPGGFGFTSNHAANHFGMAAFFYLSFRGLIGRWAWLGFVWAASIGYAQVYVGVHFPSDVVAGMALGLCYGVLTGSLYNRYGPPARTPANRE